MEAATQGVGRGDGVSAGRLLGVGLPTVLVAVAINLVIRTVTVVAFGLSGFSPSTA